MVRAYTTKFPDTISGYSHTYQCPPKSFTSGLRQVSEATITAQLVQPQGAIPEEGRRKKTIKTFLWKYFPLAQQANIKATDLSSESEQLFSFDNS